MGGCVVGVGDAEEVVEAVCHFSGFLVDIVYESWMAVLEKAKF